MANIGRTIADKIIDLLEEYGSSLAADLTSKWLLHKPMDKAIVDKAGELMAAGKKEEARELLKANPSGFGLADEELMLEDLLFVSASKVVSKKRADALAQFLANNLNDDERNRIRIGHSKEPDEATRRRKLIRLAQKSTTAAKRQYLKAAGYLDPSPLNSLTETVREWEQPLRRFEARQRRDNRPRQWRVRGRNITWLRTALLFPLRPITTIVGGFSLPWE